MFIQQINLENYRNYAQQELKLNQGINVLLGENGQGKTNLLESIYYLATGTNFRGNKDSELIQWNKMHFRISATLQKDVVERPFHIEIYCDAKKQKQIKINGVKYKKMAELLGYIQVVLFSPEDLKIIKGGPQERRRFLDLEISQLDKRYYSLYQSYQKTLQQRNNLLKSLRYNKSLMDQLLIWDHQLIHYGSEIIHRRIQYLKILIPIARSFQQELTLGKESLDITYQSSLGNVVMSDLEKIKVNYQEIIAKNRAKEIEKGVTLWGPHRDDLSFYLNKNDLKTYGSQGQQRTAVLALKLAEIKSFKYHNNDYPILLLDDVMSELDDQRRSYLLRLIKDNHIQTIITGANEELICGEISNDEVFRVKSGKVEINE